MQKLSTVELENLEKEHRLKLAKYDKERAAGTQNRTGGAK